MKIFFKIIIGVVFGIFVVITLSPFFASFTDTELAFIGTISSIVAFLVTAVLAVTAPTIRRSFGRPMLILGISFFVLPISTLFLSGSITHDVVTEASNDLEGTAEAVGAVIGTGLLTAFATFLGWIFGVIFTIVGLVLTLGGRREVVIAEDRTKNSNV